MILFHNIADGVNHVLHLLIGHGWVERQGNDALKVLLRHREVSLFPAELAEGGHGVRRDEVDAGTDVALVQLDNELVTVNGEQLRNNTEDIEMPAMRRKFRRCV